MIIHADGALVGSTTTAADGAFTLTNSDIDGGRRRICMSVTNVGPGISSTPDCAYIDVAGAQPMGNLDGFELIGRTANVSGWALDEDSRGATRVRIEFDGRLSWTTTTGRSRPDVAAYLGIGGQSGYALTIPGIPNGRHLICAVALNDGLGSDQNLGCRDFIVK